jgi:hypothetical protein
MDIAVFTQSIPKRDTFYREKKKIQKSFAKSLALRPFPWYNTKDQTEDYSSGRRGVTRKVAELIT